MKKFAFIAAVLALTACSKESEIALQETAKDRVELSEEGNFVVGIAQNGEEGVITYNLDELEEICACAVSEDNATGLFIKHNGATGEYFLSGVGSSTSSNTTFAVMLQHHADGELTWNENAAILTCSNTDTEPCAINLVDGEDFSCSSPVAGTTCGAGMIGGSDGEDYAVCNNWPWLVTKKGGK